MLSSMGSMGVSGGGNKSGLSKSAKGDPREGNVSANVSAASSPAGSPMTSRRTSLDAEAANEAEAAMAANSSEREQSAGPSILSYVGGLISSPALRGEVPEKLSATVAYKMHAEPCTDVAFTEEGVVTACAAGVVKMWSRPLTK
jgi:hypothetical protein